MFRGDGSTWYLRLIGSGFGALAGSASFNIVNNASFLIGPPVVFCDSVQCSFYSRVSSSCRVVVEGKHPPFKFVVFRDNKS